MIACLSATNFSRVSFSFAAAKGCENSEKAPDVIRDRIATVTATSSRETPLDFKMCKFPTNITLLLSLQDKRAASFCAAALSSVVCVVLTGICQRRIRTLLRTFQRIRWTTSSSPTVNVEFAACAYSVSMVLLGPGESTNTALLPDPGFRCAPLK